MAALITRIQRHKFGNKRIARTYFQLSFIFHCSTYVGGFAARTLSTASPQKSYGGLKVSRFIVVVMFELVMTRSSCRMKTESLPTSTESTTGNSKELLKE